MTTGTFCMTRDPIILKPRIASPSYMPGWNDPDCFRKLVRLEGSMAEMKWIESVHDKAYIERFKSVSQSGRRSFECEDNQLCYQTYDIARLAVGGILEASKHGYGRRPGQCFLCGQSPWTSRRD